MELLALLKNTASLPRRLEPW